MISLEIEKIIGDSSFILKMKVLESDNTPKQIFVWQTDAEIDKFSNVASVSNLSSFDVEGTIGSTFFREDFLEQEFESVAQLEECFESYQTAIKQLEIDFVNSTEELQFGEVFEIIINEDL